MQTTNTMKFFNAKGEFEEITENTSVSSLKFEKKYDLPIAGETEVVLTNLYGSGSFSMIINFTTTPESEINSTSLYLNTDKIASRSDRGSILLCSGAFLENEDIELKLVINGDGVLNHVEAIAIGGNISFEPDVRNFGLCAGDNYAILWKKTLGGFLVAKCILTDLLSGNITYDFIRGEDIWFCHTGADAFQFLRKDRNGNIFLVNYENMAQRYFADGNDIQIGGFLSTPYGKAVVYIREDKLYYRTLFEVGQSKEKLVPIEGKLPSSIANVSGDDGTNFVLTRGVSNVLVKMVTNAYKSSTFKVVPSIELEVI